MKKYILGAVLSLGILMTPAASYAAGLTSVQIQSILSLLSAFGADSATIANVTTALNGGTPSTTSGGFCHRWNTDLTVGSTGADVTALNQALTSSGIDTTGNTSFFSENNAGDVVSFQSRYGIRQTGYVGPMTRAKLNALYGCENAIPTTPVPAVSTKAPTCALNIAYGTGGILKKYGLTGTGYYDGSGSSYVEIHQGDPVTVSWSSTNADYAKGPGGDKEYTNSSATYYPEGPKAYVWNFYGPGGSTSCGVMVEILLSKPVTAPPAATTYQFSFKNTSEFVLQMAVKKVPLDLRYDINKDGKVTSADALAYLSQTSIPQAITDADKAYVVGLMSVGTVPADLAYDINKDGKVTSADALQYEKLAAPYVTNTFSYQQGTGAGALMDAFFTYQIQNYRSGLVLEVEPTVNCSDTYLAPYKRDCSQFWFNLSGKAAEVYTNVQGNPYAKGGALYRFTGSNGSLNLSGFLNPSYVPESPYINPVPDNIDYRFILRDLNQGGATVWSQTLRAQFKG